MEIRFEFEDQELAASKKAKLKKTFDLGPLSTRCLQSYFNSLTLLSRNMQQPARAGDISNMSVYNFLIKWSFQDNPGRRPNVQMFCPKLFLHSVTRALGSLLPASTHCLTMALISLSRWHLAIFIAFIFLLFQLIETSLFKDTVKFPSFRPFSGKSSASLDPTLVNFSFVERPTSDQPLPLTITNNKATYPRLSSIGLSHSDYVNQAKIQLQRIESVRSILFNGTDLNDGMITRLVSYLRRAESDKNYVPPKVRPYRTLLVLE
jgi:hypothetical protein